MTTPNTQKIHNFLAYQFRNRRVEVEPLVELVCLRVEYPDTKPSELAPMLPWSHTVFYRRWKILKEAKILNEDGSLNLTFNYMRDFALPRPIKDGTLLSSNASYAALANLLSHYGPNETPPGFHHTKSEIVDKFFTAQTTSPVGVQITTTAQNALGFFAIASGQLESFSDMVGRVPIMSEEDFPEVF